MKLTTSGLIASLLIMVSACTKDEDVSLSIRIAEEHGFKKEDQQLFQMIGAIDGWGGKWEGETVELYQFESEEKIREDLFETSTDEGNISGWKDKCKVNNMFMISKGLKACPILKSIISKNS